MSNSNLLRIRIGKTFVCAAKVLIGEEAESLEYRDLTVFLVNPRGIWKEITDWTLTGSDNNKVTFTFQGKDQRVLGTYRLVVYENYESDGQSVLDRNIVTLVPYASMETDSYVTSLSDVEIDIDLGSLTFTGPRGYTPYAQDGYWYINGVTTGIRCDYSSEEALRASAEQARVSAEQNRVNAESARVLAEDARVLAEQARVAVEAARVNAEQGRVSAEALRVTAEDARVLAEQARVTAEAARAAAEIQRAQGEQSRTTAFENQMAAQQTTFEGKMTDIDTAVATLMACEATLTALQTEVTEIGAEVSQQRQTLKDDEQVIAAALNELKEASDTATQNISTLQTNVANKVSTSDIINDVTTGGTDKVLSAEQGKELKNEIDEESDTLDEDEQVSAAALNDLNTRINSVESSVLKVESVLGEDALKVTSSTLADGSSVTLTQFPQSNKKGDNVLFFAKISSFSGLRIGKGYGAYNNIWFEIDGTNVILKNYVSSEATLATEAHGLTIDTFISISISCRLNDKCVLNIDTLGGSFSHTFDEWTTSINGVWKATSVGSSLTDIAFNATNQDFRCPVWAFGDSYFGITDSRWPGQLKNFGYYNYLINGYAGRGSNNGYLDLVKCLNFGTPKYLLWCLLGNDTLANYKSYLSQVISLCEAKGITLILLKMPNGCSNPTISTTYSDRDYDEYNAYMETLGYRYINLKEAVGESGGVWYTGYCSDGIHPTTLGAKAMAMQVLKDFPEIMQYGTTSDSASSGGDEDAVGY